MYRTTPEEQHCSLVFDTCKPGSDKIQTVHVLERKSLYKLKVEEMSKQKAENKIENLQLCTSHKYIYEKAIHEKISISEASLCGCQGYCLETIVHCVINNIYINTIYIHCFLCQLVTSQLSLLVQCASKWLILYRCWYSVDIGTF